MTANGKRQAAGHVPRVYVDQTLGTGVEVSLSGDKAHHLRTVLRLGMDDTLILFDGSGGEYEARIEDCGKRSVTIAVQAHIVCRRESPLELTLAQGIARGDRMDFALAKAVELGAARIQPLFTARGKVKFNGDRLARKTEHWRRVAISAAEQSGRERIPVLHAPLSLPDFLAAYRPQAGLVLDPRAETRLRTLPAATAATLLVGPEAGLGDDEVRQASSAGYTAIGLGPRVLRTETAGIACLAALQALWGDLG